MKIRPILLGTLFAIILVAIAGCVAPYELAEPFGSRSHSYRHQGDGYPAPFRGARRYRGYDHHDDDDRRPHRYRKGDDDDDDDHCDDDDDD